jgi:hypothetical protein
MVVPADVAVKRLIAVAKKSEGRYINWNDSNLAALVRIRIDVWLIYGVLSQLYDMVVIHRLS